MRFIDLLEKTQSTLGIKITNPFSMDIGKTYMMYDGSGENIHIEYLGNRDKKFKFRTKDGSMKNMSITLTEPEVKKKIRVLDKFYYKH